MKICISRAVTWDDMLTFSSNRLDTIYKYNVNNDTWTLLPQKLNTERIVNMGGMTGQILDDDICSLGSG